MIRKAFVMSVNPGSEGEYTRRHNPIGPDLETTLKAHGVHNYSIFLLEKTLQLFAYVEIETSANGPPSPRHLRACAGGAIWRT